MCVLKDCSDIVKCCPPAGSALPSSVISSRHVSGWAVPPARNSWPVLPSDWHLRHGRTTPSPSSSILRLVLVSFFVGCCCVGVPVVDVGMCVCGAACSARCGVLQRHHNFDAFLKRHGKRQPQELVRRWIRTATRHSSSDDSPCGHLCVP